MTRDLAAMRACEAGERVGKVTGYVVDGHGYQQAQWLGKLPHGWKPMSKVRYSAEALILLHWASPHGDNPTTEICVWNSHGGGKGAWMVTSGRSGAELPRLDGGELFDGFPAEKRRPAMKGVRLIAWQRLPYSPIAEPTP